MKWTNKGHQYDAIGTAFKNRKKLYIYGAGKIGKEAYHYFSFLNCVAGFIDNDKQKQKDGYLGLKVYDLDEIREEYRGEDIDYVIIVALSELNRPAVMKQLLTSGFQEGRDFFSYHSFVDLYLPVYAAYAHDMLYNKAICLIPTRRCPLNCEYCLNCIPDIENPTEDDIEDVKKDLDMLFSCVDYLGLMSIAGGEIFLYSHCKELFEYIGIHYREKIHTLSITTSTAVLPDDATFEVLKKYGVTVHVSDYRQAIPGLSNAYTRFLSKMKDFGIPFVLFESNEWFDIGTKRENDIYCTETDRIRHFDMCAIPWSFYMKGKIYACNWAGFATMAGVRADSPEDAFDLHTCTKENDRRNTIRGGGGVTGRFAFNRAYLMELMEFGTGFSEKGYVQMCSKCYGYITVNHHSVPVARQIPRKHKD